MNINIIFLHKHHLKWNRGRYFSRFQEKKKILKKLHQNSEKDAYQLHNSNTCFPSSFPSSKTPFHFTPPYSSVGAGPPRRHPNSGQNMDDYGKLFVAETSFYNRIVLGGLLPERLWTPLPHFVQGWLRNYIAGTLLYFISGFLWCFYIYYLKRSVYIPKGTIFTSLSFVNLDLSFDIIF